MRYVWLLNLGFVLLVAGCGMSPSDKDAAGGGSTDAVSSGAATTGGGKIIEPAEKQVPPPPVAASALEKLSTADLILELGKPPARDAASKLLAAKGSAVVPELVEALKHEDPQVRTGAVFTLGRLGKAAAPALPELKKLLEAETDETVKDAAAFAMDAIAGE